MAEDDDRGAAGFVVPWCQRAPERRAGPKNLEEVSRDEPALPPNALDPCVNIRRRREGGREHGRLAEEGFVFEARRDGVGLRGLRPRAIDFEQLVRLTHVVRAKDEGVQKGEHDGHQPEAEPDR
jgi:hypothetical protein